jgi:hypothetical protein
VNRAIATSETLIDARDLQILTAWADRHGVSIVVQVEDVPDDPIVLSKALLRAKILGDLRIIRDLVDRPCVLAAADLRL